MRANHLQNLFHNLSLLGAAVSGVGASTHTVLSPKAECSVQAWVRAPDLAPGTIVQGNARLKLTAGCTAVESASLGLRFKERSFVKASHSIEATKQPVKEQIVIDIFGPEGSSPSSPWLPPAGGTSNCSADIAFREIISNKDLWLVRDEERIVFESTQAIDMGETPPGSVRDVVRDFTILVPLTNFPPALDYLRSHIAWSEGEFVNVEAIYEYFIRVAFTNGTTVEMPAGFTAFHPLYDPPSSELVRSKTVHLQTKESLDGSLVDGDPVANYTATIISKHDGFVLSQGSDQIIKVTITRTGRARTFIEPLVLLVCIDPNLSAKWASEYTSDPSLQSLHRPNQVLRATSADFEPCTSPSTSRCHPFNQAPTPNRKLIFMPNATSDQIAAADIVTTTSAPVQFLMNTDPRHITDFEMYYHTLSSALFISLDVPRTQEEPPNPKDAIELWAMQKKAPVVEADEEAWVPWSNVPEVRPWRSARTYAGNVPVSVYPADEALVPKHCVRDRIVTTEMASKQVVVASNDDHLGCALHSSVHYLSESARAPIFVDESVASVQELRAKTPMERDTLAPFLEPMVSSPPEGEERVQRYYRVPEGHRPLIYVGETWVKKMTHRDEFRVTVPRRDRIPDALARMTEAMSHVFDEL